MMLYGPEVDFGDCGACYEQVEESYDEQEMMQDPNAMVRRLADMADECMGQTNQITSGCEDAYGEDVPLFDCMMCGEICQCNMESCDEECHGSCMAGVPELDSSSDGPDCTAECQMFYGPEATAEQCNECGQLCFEAANTAVEELAMSGQEVAMEDFEVLWFDSLISCSDECMGQYGLVNIPEGKCKAPPPEGYGENVNLLKCYHCGMMCGCDLEGNCEWCDHGECMAREGPPEGPNGLLQSKKTMSRKNPNAPKAAFAHMKTRARKAVAKKLRQQKQFRAKKADAFAKLMKHKKPDRRGGSKPSDSSSSDSSGPPCDGEVAGTCMMLYGHEVDLGQCATCYGQVAGEYSEAGMIDDPNGMVRTLADMADECMGETNQITAVCEEHYGEDVPLFDCMMCGEICMCTMEGCPEPECHPGCMAGDSSFSGTDGSWTDSSSSSGYDCTAECQMFYGPNATSEQCNDCGGQCFEAAEGAAAALFTATAEYDEEFFKTVEQVWFSTLISCSDDCMAPLQNIPEGKCKDAYGDDVDLMSCYSCGMMCGCDLDGNCEWCDHGACMAGEFDYSSASWDSTYSSWSFSDSTPYSTWTTLQKVNKRASKAVHPMHASKNLHKRFQAAMTKIKKQGSDVTDLMQTSKHLK